MSIFNFGGGQNSQYWKWDSFPPPLGNESTIPHSQIVMGSTNHDFDFDS